MTIQKMSKQSRIQHLKSSIRDLDQYLQNAPLSLNCGEADRLNDIRSGYQEELQHLEQGTEPEYIVW